MLRYRAEMKDAGSRCRRPALFIPKHVLYRAQWWSSEQRWTWTKMLTCTASSVSQPGGLGKERDGALGGGGGVLSPWLTGLGWTKGAKYFVSFSVYWSSGFSRIWNCDLFLHVCTKSEDWVTRENKWGDICVNQWYIFNWQGWVTRGVPPPISLTAIFHLYVQWRHLHVSFCVCVCEGGWGRVPPEVIMSSVGGGGVMSTLLQEVLSNLPNLRLKNSKSCKNNYRKD